MISSSDYDSNEFNEKMGQISSEIMEAKRINTKLRKEAKDKILKLSQLEDEIARENEGFESSIMNMNQISQNEYDYFKSECEDLLIAKENITLNLSKYETTQYENSMLKNKFDDLSTELFQLKEYIRITYDERYNM